MQNSQKNEDFDRNFQLLPLSREEIDAVLSIEDASFSTPWSRQMFSEETQIPFSSFYVMKTVSSAELAGYGGFWAVRGEAHLLNIAVAPSFRKRGLGRFLLRKLFEKMRERNCAVVFLEVRRSNLPARMLYESEGFTMAGERKNYYNNPQEDALIYLKKV